MQKRHYSRPELYAGLALSVVSIMLLPTRSSAIESLVLRIPAGETLEIGIDTLSSDAQFSWILTKDRKFQSAARTKFFQTRLSEPGDYVLDVSIQNPMQSQNTYHAFTLVVTEPTDTLPARKETESPLQAVLVTDPPIIDGKIYLSPQGGILKIDPWQSKGKINRYTVDTNNLEDSDSDGNFLNDRNTADTFLEKDGTPAYLYLEPTTAGRLITLSVSDLSNPSASTASAELLFETSPVVYSSASSSVQATQGGPIKAEPEGGFRIRFSAPLDRSLTTGKELLYEWDFGDRAKSLLNEPVHTYGSAGTYTVGLSIRDITTADVIYSTATSIVVQGVPEPVASVSSAVSSVASSVPTESSVRVSLPWKSIVYVVLIIVLLLALAVGLYMAFTWIKRRTTSSLQQTLERMEGSIVKKDAKAEIGAPLIEPMKLKKDTPLPKKPDSGQKSLSEIGAQEKKRTELMQAKQEPPPAIAGGPVPDWLKKASPKPVATTPPVPQKSGATSSTGPGLSFSQPPSSTPKPLPPPESAPTPRRELPTPPPSSASPEPASATGTGPVPDWLKAPETKKAVQTTDAPKPGAPPAPATPTPLELKKAVEAPPPIPETSPGALQKPSLKISIPTDSPAPSIPAEKAIAQAPAVFEKPVAPVISPTPNQAVSAPKPATPAPAATPAPSPAVSAPPPLKPASPISTPPPTSPVSTPAPKAEAALPKPQLPVPPQKVQEEKSSFPPLPSASKMIPQSSSPTTTVAIPENQKEIKKPEGKSFPMSKEIPKSTTPIKKTEPKKPSEGEPPIAIIQADSLTK